MVWRAAWHSLNNRRCHSVLSSSRNPLHSRKTKLLNVSFIMFRCTSSTPANARSVGNGAITRVFDALAGLDEISVKSSKPGFNRRAGVNQDRDSWITVVSRLATRSLTGLDMPETTSLIKQESKNNTFSLSDNIRDALHLYIIGDFRKRIDVAISWLNEEWYNDRIQARSTDSDTSSTRTPTYERLVLKLIDALVPYLDAKDQKVLIRFLSEIPLVTKDILERIKRLARDPERVPLAVNAIQCVTSKVFGLMLHDADTLCSYLILFRPPAREDCIDAVEDLYRNCKLLRELRDWTERSIY
jgi:symplekin